MLRSHISPVAYLLRKPGALEEGDRNHNYKISQMLMRTEKEGIGQGGTYEGYIILFILNLPLSNIITDGSYFFSLKASLFRAH